MPNTKAQEAASARTSNVARNRSVRSAVRTQVRKVREAVQATDVERPKRNSALPPRNLDQAGARKVIHPNAAARSIAAVRRNFALKQG